MPTPTYIAIAKTVLTSDQINITFSGISSSYTDLLLVYSARGKAAQASTDLYLTFNATATGYSSTMLTESSATTVASYRTSSNTKIEGYYAINGDSATANTFGSGEIYIPNYTGSTQKAVSISSVGENNSSAAQPATSVYAGLSNITSAITSITISFYVGSGNSIVSGSRFDLYGIKNS